LSRHHTMVKGQQCVSDLASQASHSPKLLADRVLYCQSSGVRTPVIGSSRRCRLHPGVQEKKRQDRGKQLQGKLGTACLTVTSEVAGSNPVVPAQPTVSGDSPSCLK